MILEKAKPEQCEVKELHCYSTCDDIMLFFTDGQGNTFLFTKFSLEQLTKMKKAIDDAIAGLNKKK